MHRTIAPAFHRGRRRRIPARWQRDGIQSVLVGVERRVAKPSRCRQQPAVEVVSPGMVRAEDAAVAKAAARLGADARTAMAAGVVKRAQAGVAARHDNALVADVESQEAARLAELGHMADTQPVAQPDGVELAAVLPDIEVPRAWQRSLGLLQQGRHRRRRPARSESAIVAQLPPVARGPRRIRCLDLRLQAH